MKINVIDSCMGSGKTSWAIEKMKNDNKNKYIYITPFLSEVKRIKENCKERKFVEPEHKGNGKQDNFHDLILNNRNIVSTHALFSMSNETTKELLSASEYILILDEVMDVIEQYGLKKDDMPTMLEQKLITIVDDFVIWNPEKLDYDGRYNDIKNMSLNNSLIYVSDKLLMWNFPVDIFKSFKDIYILTYMFKAQVQKYYYDLYNVEYEYFSVTKSEDKYILTQNDNNLLFKQNLKSKINILENDKINNIGDKDFTLSVNWYEKRSSADILKLLKNNLTNYFINKQKAKSDDIIWTTFKNYESKLSGKGYTKSFIPYNIRATNEYGDRHNLAYCVNTFLNPVVNKFFVDRNVKVEEDLYALSEMLQWIWRSAIRNNEEINIYIPSKRMRYLLLNFLKEK